jgi:xanthine dehydrogenase small subunit
MIRGFHRPATIEEAVALKLRLGPRAVFLAGGTDVNARSSRPAPEHVISLQSLPLRAVRLGEAGLEIGACCTIQDVLTARQTPPCLRAAARHIVNRNVRNLATIGGHLALNKSCADLIPILVALESSVRLADADGARELPLLEYLQGGRVELLTHVLIRAERLQRAAAVRNYSRSANDISIVTAAAVLDRDGDEVRDPAIAVGGVAEHVVRLPTVESALDGAALPEREKLEKLVQDSVKPISDLRGSAEFKRRVAAYMVAATVYEAWHGGEDAADARSV